MADFFVMEWESLKRLLDPAGEKFVIDALVQHSTLWNFPRSSNAALAFHREAAQNELAHVVLRTFSEGDDVGNALVIGVELRRGNEIHIQVSAARVVIVDRIPRSLDFHPVGRIACLERDEYIELRGGYRSVAGPGDSIPRKCDSRIDRSGHCNFGAPATLRYLPSRRPKLDVKKRPGKVERLDLLQLKQLDGAARVRLADEIFDPGLNSAIILRQRIGELDAFDGHRRIVRVKFLNLLVAERCIGQRMRNAGVQTVRDEHGVQSIGHRIQNRSVFGSGAVEEHHGFLESGGKLVVRKPWKVIESDRNGGRILHLILGGYAGVAGSVAVFHRNEWSKLRKEIGAFLQIVPRDHGPYVKAHRFRDLIGFEAS